MDKQEKYNNIFPTVKGGLEAHFQRIYNERPDLAGEYRLMLDRLLHPFALKAIVLMFDEGMVKALDEQDFQTTRRALGDILLEVSVGLEPLIEIIENHFSTGYMPFVDSSISKFRRTDNLFCYYHIFFCATSRGLVVHTTAIPFDNALPAFFANDLMSNRELQEMGL